MVEDPIALAETPAANESQNQRWNMHQFQLGLKELLSHSFQPPCLLLHLHCPKFVNFNCKLRVTARINLLQKYCQELCKRNPIWKNIHLKSGYVIRDFRFKFNPTADALKGEVI